MATNIEFKVVEAYDYERFCSTVQSLLNSNWELHGSMIAFPNFVDEGKVESVRYIQALVKKSKSSTPYVAVSDM